MTKSNPDNQHLTTVTIGQIYRDRDKRTLNRNLVVDCIDGDKAYMLPVHRDPIKPGEWNKSSSYKPIRIRLDRLTKPALFELVGHSQMQPSRLAIVLGFLFWSHKI